MSKINDHTIRVTVTLSLFPDEDNAVALDPNEHRDAIVNALDAALSDVEVTVYLAPETEEGEETEVTFGGEMWDAGEITKIDS